jgi:hypothetical protein
MKRVWVLSVVAISLAGMARAGDLSNSIGPAYIAEDLVGINYERAISHWFCLDALAASSGDIDFGGVRLVLSRTEPSFQIRPSLGICMVRGKTDEGDPDPHTPWFGFLWPSLGMHGSKGHFAGTIDFGLIYGNTGEEDEAYGVLSASLMYRF